MPTKAPSGSITRRQLASLDEAAQYFGCSTKTLRRRIADGTITGYRSGPRAVRIDLNEAENALLRPIPSARGGAA